MKLFWCNNVNPNKIMRDCSISSPLTAWNPYLPTFLYTADTKQALIRSPTPTPQKNSWWKKKDWSITVRKKPAAST